jgi:hypothetical protein
MKPRSPKLVHIISFMKGRPPGGIDHAAEGDEGDSYVATDEEKEHMSGLIDAIKADDVESACEWMHRYLTIKDEGGGEAPPTEE